jgi:hypothetical protein
MDWNLLQFIWTREDSDLILDNATRIGSSSIQTDWRGSRCLNHETQGMVYKLFLTCRCCELAIESWISRDICLNPQYCADILIS